MPQNSDVYFIILEYNYYIDRVLAKNCMLSDTIHTILSSN